MPFNHRVASDGQGPILAGPIGGRGLPGENHGENEGDGSQKAVLEEAGGEAGQGKEGRSG